MLSVRLSEIGRWAGLGVRDISLISRAVPTSSSKKLSLAFIGIGPHRNFSSFTLKISLHHKAIDTSRIIPLLNSIYNAPPREFSSLTIKTSSHHKALNTSRILQRLSLRSNEQELRLSGFALRKGLRYGKNGGGVDGGGFSLHCRNICYLHEKLPDNFNLARDVVQPLAHAKGNKPCLIFSDGKNNREEVTYRQLFDSSVHLATALRSSSINSHGSSHTVSSGGQQRATNTLKIALVIVPKIPAWWVINIAAYWYGFTVCPGTSLLRGKDLHYRLAQSGANCVFCGPGHVSAIDQAEENLGKKGQLQKVVVAAPTEFNVRGWVRYEDLVTAGASMTPTSCHEHQPGDICQLFFTSGTTGNPKMVPHTHASYARGQQITARTWLDMKEDDVLCNVSDTGWAKAAWSFLYVPLLSGATAFIHQMERFEPKLLLEALHQEGVSVMCAPPTAYRALVQMPLQDYTFRRLRHCVSAGEPLNPEVMKIWASKTGVEVYEGYGQSETTLICATMPGMTIKPGAMGPAAPGYQITVLDDNLDELPSGQEGQIAIRAGKDHPDGLFREYYSDPIRSEAVFRNGHYLTGDRGHLDDDGYLWFVARDDDVIISSGYRIGPFEVESALLEHSEVVESGVVGVPDTLRGHVVKAFVVLSDAAAARVAGSEEEETKLKQQLQAHVKTTTAPYKYPRQIEFVSSLPKTVSGKIRRVELRQQSTGKTTSSK